MLDEPTASLDKDNVKNVEALIRQYKQDIDAPVIWVSHDPQQIERVADKHKSLQDGELKEVAV